MRTVTAYQAPAPNTPLHPTRITRRDVRPDDVAIRVTHCGVCHSDLHALNDLAGVFPLVPGHEFVGDVIAVGSQVRDFTVGDAVAVGNIVDSCGECDMCRAEQENYCREFPTLTYGGRDRHDGTPTHGAYAGEYVVRDRFAYHRPAHLDPAGVAPLLCAGITVWEPLRRWNVGAGTRVGVVGLGGLGHLAVKLAVALGAQVSVFTTSAAKADDATRLGAHCTVLSTDPAAMAAAQGSCDLVLDCVPAPHDLAPYLQVLALDGTLCSLGHLGPVTVETTALLIGRKSLASAGSGGHRYTQDLLDFAGRHGITADVEVVPSAQVNTALQRLAAGDVRYRFTLDLSDVHPS
ncbi:NAD(P)-dependent alcohol dehydrogenase [Kineococcus radiotolerans]|uniref:alcohol dehydrogenase (NADP(+)) n=1 Tax=Kineococcus radiotolerans (strain ATCC BAA-149 / DSM 14245 / SRS30216) TaxID=266940 RepID=A6WBA5_KINRD|nr:NAD(P)-dependent alcohol dehydrogenase [Kineococcus radiotolerans]ABS04094.1 Alcohol dehydrogenase GroES domain protein [Kineococcus radiotolerans SRS30216 = ATCC BAA-149]